MIDDAAVSSASSESFKIEALNGFVLRGLIHVRTLLRLLVQLLLVAKLFMTGVGEEGERNAAAARGETKSAPAIIMVLLLHRFLLIDDGIIVWLYY